MATERDTSNEAIRAACGPFDPSARYAEWTRVVYRVSDSPPKVVVYGELPSYINPRYVWGSATPEAEALVAEREQQFRAAWGR